MINNKNTWISIQEKEFMEELAAGLAATALWEHNHKSTIMDTTKQQLPPLVMTPEQIEELRKALGMTTETKGRILKFYTPEIEELYIGFRYEQFSHLKGLWEHMILDLSHFQTIIDEELCDWSEHHIRVKYLDKEDIESLGFKQGKLPYQFFDGIHMLITDRFNRIKIEHIADQVYIFDGIIKNKSELIKLLKQLEIN